MKKVLVLAVLAVFVMMPLASFAKTAISDSELNAVTAQEGVSIDLSGLSIDGINIDVNSTGDGDGWGTASAYSAQGWSGSSISIGGDVIAFGTTALMIDCGTGADGTKTKITLPTITIGGTAGLTIEQVNKYSNVKTLAAGTATTVSGTTYMGGVKATLSGSIVMYAH